MLQPNRAPLLLVKPAMGFRVGIGSWADPEYKVILPAPEGVPASERLRAYAAHFDHVEVNATAYRTPSPKQVEAWIEQTPPGFTFSVKLHQRFSRDPSGAASDTKLVRRIRDAFQPLVAANRFTCFLLVLPPTFGPAKHALEELAPLIEALAPLPIAVELRHRAWVDADRRAATISAFRSRGLIWVAVDIPPVEHRSLLPAIDEVTHPAIAYLRCHGRNPRWPELKSAAEKHAYAYPPEELEALAARARTLARSAERVHVIANNHASDYAPRTALALRRLLAS